MRLMLLFFVCFSVTVKCYAFQDTTLKNNYQAPQDSAYRYAPNGSASLIDSVAAAMANHEKYVADSVAMQYIRVPDSNRVNQFAKYVFSTQLYKGYGFLDIHPDRKSILREGTARPSRERWIILVVIGLLLYAGLVNLVMNKDTDVVLQSFYNKRSVQSGKEESLINSRAFLALFVLFGLTSGLFIYQVSAAYDKYYSITGFQLFLSLSLIIVVLFALKLLVLRFIGFVFNVNRIVGDYISILYLTYFNIAFVFLPLTLCFCLLPPPFAPFILAAGIVLIIIIFVWQYLRSSVGIISNFRFHKFYLFIYLCALEICPVLILIKALNI